MQCTTRTARIHRGDVHESQSNASLYGANGKSVQHLTGRGKRSTLPLITRVIVCLKVHQRDSCTTINPARAGPSLRYRSKAASSLIPSVVCSCTVVMYIPTWAGTQGHLCSLTPHCTYMPRFVGEIVTALSRRHAT